MMFTDDTVEKAARFFNDMMAEDDGSLLWEALPEDIRHEMYLAMRSTLAVVERDLCEKATAP